MNDAIYQHFSTSRQALQGALAHLCSPKVVRIIFVRHFSIQSTVPLPFFEKDNVLRCPFSQEKVSR